MLRDLRSAPFCWQEKTVMRKLRAHYTGAIFSHRATAIAIYQALTEVASNQNSQNEARAFVRQLAELAGCSDRTAQRYIREFEEIGLVVTHRNRLDERTNLANTYSLVSSTAEGVALVASVSPPTDSSGPPALARATTRAKRKPAAPPHLEPTALVSPTPPAPTAATNMVSPTPPAPTAVTNMVPPMSPAAISTPPVGDPHAANDGDRGVALIEPESEPIYLEQQPAAKVAVVGSGVDKRLKGSSGQQPLAAEEDWRRTVARRKLTMRVIEGGNPPAEQVGPPSSPPPLAEDEQPQPPLPTPPEKVDEAQQELIQNLKLAMIGLGVDERTAQLLAAERDPQLVAGWLHYVQTEPGISRPAALLVSRLRANEAVPARATNRPQPPPPIAPPTEDKLARDQQRQQEAALALLVSYEVDEATLRLWLAVQERLAVEEPEAYRRCFRDAFLARPAAGVALIVLPPRVPLAEAERHVLTLRQLLLPVIGGRDLVIEFEHPHRL